MPVERSLDALAKLAQDLEPGLRSSLLARVQEFRSFVSGPDSIVETRRRELDLIAEGRRLLAQNAEVSSRLTNVVSGMVSVSGSAGAPTQRAARSRRARPGEISSAPTMPTGTIGVSVSSASRRNPSPKRWSS